MPTYVHTLPDGRKVRLTGDSPPTEAEFEHVIANLPAAARGASRATRLLAGMKPAEDIVRGGLKGIGTTVVGLGQLAATAPPVRAFSEMLSGGMTDEALEQSRTALQPQGPLEHAGFIGEQIGEFAGAGLARAPAMLGRLRPMLSKLASGAGRDAGVAAAQTGGDPLSTGLAGGASAAMSLMPITRPFAGLVNKPVAAAAQRIGVEDLPLSSLSKAYPLPLLESAAAKGLFGTRTAVRIEHAFEQLMSVAQGMEARSKVAAAQTAGRLTIEGIKRFREAQTAANNAVYSGLIPRTGLPMVPERTMALLGEMLDGARRAQDIDPGAVSKLESILRAVSPRKTKQGMVPKQAFDLWSQIKALNNVINNPLDVTAKGSERALKKVAATFKEEFDELLSTAKPEAADTLRAANAAHSAAMSKLDNAVGKAFARLAEQPSAMIQTLVRPSTDISNIRRLTSMLDEPTMEEIRGYVLADIVGATGKLTPKHVAQGIKRWSPDKLRALLRYDQMEKLNDLNMVAQSMEAGERVLHGSQTMYLARLGELGAIFVNPALGLKILAGDAAISTMVGTTWGRKYLLEGFGGEGLEQLVRSVSAGTAGQVGR